MNLATIELEPKALVGNLTSGILSLSVYAGIFIGAACTMMGVPVMDLITMIEWCGGVLRVTKRFSYCLDEIHQMFQ